MFSLLAKRQPCSLVHRLPPSVAKLFASKPKSHNPDPKTSSNFMVDYLISSFGFSPDKATKVSKTIAYVKSPEKPDSVRHFLKHNGGFSEDQIKTIITWRPQILSCSLEKTLEPNLRSLREMGLSSPAVTQIVLSDPAALLYKNAVSRIRFMKDFLGGSEALLVRAGNTNRSIASHDIVPKISLLHSLGLSTHEIQRIILMVARFINNSPTLMKDLLSRAKELGFQPGLPMFVSGLRASSNSRGTLLKKVELFKSYGWSEDDFFSAFRKFPGIVEHAEMNLQMKMDFLIAEVRCEPSYIAANPVIFSYSLDKRLKPRQNVLHLLKSNGLSSKEHNFCQAMKMTDSKFVKTYILPHGEEIAGLHEAYLSACA